MSDARLTDEERNLPATKGDLAAGLRYLESKIDAKVDKSDLERFATKDDLKQFATKDVMDRVIVRLINLEEDVKEIKETMATKDDINKILNAVDTVMSQYQEIKIEQVSNLSAHQRFEKRLEKLESRAA